jgi:hypothetical protein
MKVPLGAVLEHATESVKKYREAGVIHKPSDEINFLIGCLSVHHPKIANQIKEYFK